MLYFIFIDLHAEERLQYREEERTYRMMLDSKSSTIDSFTIMIIIVVCQCIRLMINLKYNTILGAFIQIMIRMAKDSFFFLIIFVMFILIFALTGYALFYDLEQFSTYYNSLTYLYE